jgi:hypothetical protein
MAVPIQVVFDAESPARLASFWAAAVGYIVQPPPEGWATWEAWAADHGIPEEDWDRWAAAIDPAGHGPRFFFQKVPEGKTAKNRVHLDLNVSTDVPRGSDERRRRVDQEAERLVGMGATKLASFDERGEYWVGMLDPEGNELDLQ